MEYPWLPQIEKNMPSNEDPAQLKINKQIKLIFTKRKHMKAPGKTSGTPWVSIPSGGASETPRWFQWEACESGLRGSQNMPQDSGLNWGVPTSVWKCLHLEDTSDFPRTFIISLKTVKGCYIFLTVLLWYNPHTSQFTHLNCTVQWFSVSSQSSAATI